MTGWLVFDVGETLASEERWLGSWADWLGVPRGTFFAALGAVIAACRPYDEVFRLFKPDIDHARERAARRAAGITDAFVLADLYPDTLPTLSWAREAGYRIGLAGNTSAETEAFLRTLPFQADFIGSAASWKASKPDAGFFHRIIAGAGCEPADITYVGDSVSNDVLPALAAGLQAIHIARGPWGVVQARAGRRRRDCAASARSPRCRHCSPKSCQIVALYPSVDQICRSRRHAVIHIIVHQSATIVG